MPNREQLISITLKFAHTNCFTINIPWYWRPVHGTAKVPLKRRNVLRQEFAYTHKLEKHTKSSKMAKNTIGRKRNPRPGPTPVLFNSHIMLLRCIRFTSGVLQSGRNEGMSSKRKADTTSSTAETRARTFHKLQSQVSEALLI